MAITKAAEIRRNPVLHDWIGRYACYHPGENPFAPEQRIITQDPALMLPGTHTKPVTERNAIRFARQAPFGRDQKRGRTK